MLHNISFKVRLIGAKIVNLHQVNFKNMERISISNRTNKTAGVINLRYRLRDGGGVDIYVRSNIKAEVQALGKLLPTGEPKPRVTNYDKELSQNIISEIGDIRRAYKSMREKDVSLTSESMAREMAAMVQPAPSQEKRKTIADRFLEWIEQKDAKGSISDGRMKHYVVVQKELEKFLIIKRKTKIVLSEFDDIVLSDFAKFLKDEYLYVGKYPHLYERMTWNRVPHQCRSNNTVATKLKIIRAFFRSMEKKGEIDKSPFGRMDDEDRQTMMHEQYDVPVYLTAKEFQTIRETDVPDYLQEAKDAFLLQISFGCRIGDYKRLSMENVGIREGIPYIHYLPQKTKKTQDTNREIETPIMMFALDIIKMYKFKFSILNYVSGKSGYNTKIKEILRYCGIDKKCTVYDEEKGTNVYLPLHELGSSKLARKTHVDMMAKVQINLYASGLHRVGSDAVKRYTDMDVEDRFNLMCRAFNCKPYRVDNDLNIIEEPQQDTDLMRMVEAMSQEEKARLLALLSANIYNKV